MHAKRCYQCFLASAGALALIAGFSCGHTTATRPPAAAAYAAASPAPAPPARTQPTAPHQKSASAQRLPLQAPEPPANDAMIDVMGDHFLITSWARDCVIAGLLDPLRAPLTALADYRYDNLGTDRFRPGLAQLQAAARLTSAAVTLDAAAMGVATMARVCGECHQKNHAGPFISAPPEPEERMIVDTVPDRMERHMGAAELLWEGLTGPSDVSWRAGAEKLIAAPDELDERMPESFDTDLSAVKELAQQAIDATTLSDRADVYGMLIATCADCHSRWIEHGGT